MESAVKIPLSERINIRVLIFILIVAAIPGYILYIMIDAQVTGGIKNAGGGYKFVDLKAMSSFELDQNSGVITDVPQKWRDLDGQKVILHGEMWQPTSANNEVAGFDLCYSIAKCCFSGPPKVQHFVKSKVQQGKSVGYYDGQVEVKGKLHVDVKNDAGKLTSVYQLDVESVEPVQ
jgi:hypothetical protein